MTLPRPQRGDYDGVWTCVPPWTDLRKMFAHIQEAVQETGEEVLAANRPAARLVGFAMHQVEEDEHYTWVWEIPIHVLKATDSDLRSLLLPLTHQRQAALAKRLSDGEHLVPPCSGSKEAVRCTIEGVPDPIEDDWALLRGDS